MEFPSHLLYTKDHEWIENNQIEAKVGITDFAQHELGDIVFVDINSIGKQLKQHEIFGTVEAVKTVSDLFLPVSGEILEINPKIISNPELVNKQPNTDGWIVKIKLANPSELTGLLTSGGYKETIGIKED